jgi:hypothetical protein
MPDPATLKTPAQAVVEPTSVTAPAAVESVTPTPEPAGETVTEAQALEAIFEARTTGNNKEADRLTKLLESARNAPVKAEPAEVVEPPAAEVTPPVEPAPATEPPAGTAPAGDDHEKEPNRLRITHLSDADKSDQIAIHALTKKGVPLAEAVQRILGPLPSAQPTPAATETPGSEQTQPAPDTSITDLESAVTQLEQQLDELSSSEGGLQGPDAARITKELSRANANLAAAKIAASFAEREAARENSAFEAQQQANDEATRKQYPALNDENSPLFQLWYELSVAAHSPSHPDHAKAQSVDSPAYFAAKAAKILGLASASKPAAPVVPAPPAAQPPPATRPAAANKGSAPPPPAKTVADVAREAEAAFDAATTGRLDVARRSIGGLIIR